MIIKWALTLLVVMFVVRLIRAAMQPNGRKKRIASAKAHRRMKTTTSDREPHEVLGVSPGASQAELKQAYQERIREYHPDRVATMGPDLQALAEQRTKEINEAYASLRRDDG